ncbi:hypothetical protein [Paracoccus siganidrum]|uniref:Uncharacterized protein n=1 Tax=Paracoccus siganidrum TaxID=1276757 RepID=A0A418ZT60_9RHOB|nr:hypothetical protein [Paracoccus siganidrum]RJK99938.1 hypothetical protein D3P05_23080 [Paracoccus siganidrum]RMC24330.1 hypothetical protein C9E82_23480 [Paracoccus siganidrum]
MVLFFAPHFRNLQSQFEPRRKGDVLQILVSALRSITDVCHAAFPSPSDRAVTADIFVYDDKMSDPASEVV